MCYYLQSGSVTVQVVIAIMEPIVWTKINFTRLLKEEGKGNR
jgi:hypothetical protein